MTKAAEQHATIIMTAPMEAPARRAARVPPWRESVTGVSGRESVTGVSARPVTVSVTSYKYSIFSKLAITSSAAARP